jgi:iron(III) transport system substrate-binding protein
VLAQQIEQEGSRSPADVFFTENTPPLARLDEKGLLAAAGTPAISAVPARYSASDGDWVGVSARVSTLVYKHGQAQGGRPAHVGARPGRSEVEGQAGLAPSETDFAPIVTSIAQDKGNAAAVAWLGYLLDVSGAAALTSSRHQAAARALVAFLVSSPGQHVLARSDSWEYPVGSGVANPDLPPTSGFQPRQFDLAQIGDGTRAVTLLQQAGLL